MPRTWTECEIQAAFGEFDAIPDKHAEAAADELVLLIGRHRETTLWEQLDRLLESALAPEGVAILCCEVCIVDEYHVTEFNDETMRAFHWRISAALQAGIIAEQHKRAEEGREAERLRQAEALALWHERMHDKKHADYRRCLLSVLLLLLWVLFFRAQLKAEGRYIEGCRRPQEDEGGQESGADMLPQLRPPGSADDDGTSGPS